MVHLRRHLNVSLFFALATMGDANLVSAGPGGTITSFKVSPTDADARLIFQADGTIDQLATAGQSQIGSWDLTGGSLNGSDYEVGYTGTPTDAFASEAAAEDAWVDLSVGATWQMLQTGIGTLTTGALTFRIRRKSDGKIMDSASYTIVADVDI
jgi:hypothetical protein